MIFVDESIFGLNWFNISEVMIDSVRDKGPHHHKLTILENIWLYIHPFLMCTGVYPINGKTPFEHMVYG